MARLSARPLKSLLLVCAHQTLVGQGRTLPDPVGSEAAAELAETDRFRFAIGPVRYALVQDRSAGAAGPGRRRMLAQFGRMPFSAEDPSSRATLKALLTLCRKTPGFRLTVGEGQVVWAVRDDPVASEASTARLLRDLFRFVHTTLPFARLLCPYLR